MNLAVLGAQWGDEGKGKDRRPAHAAFFDRRALSGRPQRGPYRVRQRHEVRAAADSCRAFSSGRDLRHRQRRGGRSEGAVRRGGRARRPASMSRHRLLVSDKAHPDPAVPSRPRSAAEARRGERKDRHHRARHRSGLRGQDRPPGHSRVGDPSPTLQAARAEHATRTSTLKRPVPRRRRWTSRVLASCWARRAAA